MAIIHIYQIFITYFDYSNTIIVQLPDQPKMYRVYDLFFKVAGVSAVRLQS